MVILIVGWENMSLINSNKEYKTVNGYKVEITAITSDKKFPVRGILYKPMANNSSKFRKQPAYWSIEGKSHKPEYDLVEL